MSDRAAPQRTSENMRAWAARVPPGIDLDHGALGRLIAQGMIPPWADAIEVIEALAAEQGVTLEVNPRTLTLGLDRAKPDCIKQTYPLFAELLRSYRQAPADPGQPAARQILVGLFGEFDGAEISIYYSQFLMVRRCLRAFAPVLPAPTSDWMRTASEACTRFETQLAQMANPRAELKDDLTQFKALVHGSRSVGERLRAGGGGHGSGKRDHHARLGEQPLSDPPRRSSLRDLGAKPGRPTSAPDHDAPVLDNPGTDTLRINAGGIVMQATMAGSDDEPPVTISMPRDSALPPKDARRVAMQIERGLSRATTSSPADYSNLPLGRIREALERVAGEPLDFIFVWLVLTTTLAPKRIALTRKASTEPADETPHFDGTHLIYRLINGPGPGAHDDSNLIVTLALPPRIARLLASWGGEEPLAGRLSRINHQLRYALGNTPGVTSTLDRLRATGYHHLAELTASRTRAQILAGGFSYGFIAPGTYRRVDAGTLQGDFAAQNTSLAESLVAISAEGNGLRPWLSSLDVPDDLTGSPSGSARAVAPEAYRPVFRALSDARAAVEETIAHAPKRSVPAARSRLETLRLEAAYTYLGFALGTGGRAIAERATAMPMPPGTQSVQHTLVYLRDKDSTAYAEARVLPLAAALVKRLDALSEAIERTVTQLRKDGWSVVDPRPSHRQPLPGWIVLRPGGQAALQVFTNAHFADVLEDYGITDPRPGPNATRHTVCTTLSSRLKEPEAHAVMGHTGAAGSYFDPESLAAPDLGAIKAALTDLLRRSGFHPP